MIPLIEETIVKPIIKEADQKNLPPGVLCRGSWLTCSIGKLNANKRMYEKAVWDKVLNDKHMLEKLNNRAAFGEGEHPKETQSDLMRTSHVVTGMRFEEAEDGSLNLYNDIDILDTPSGRIINTLVKAGCGVGVSTRAEGDLEECESKTLGKYHRVVPGAYDYKATDFTADPSTYGTAPRNVQMAVMQEAVKGVQESQLPKSQAIAILENLKLDGSDEDKQLLESSLSSLKEEKKIEVGMPAIVLRPSKIEGAEDQQEGKVVQIEEATVTIELEDGTTISTETARLSGDHVEVTLPALEPMDDLPPEVMDDVPPEEEAGLEEEPTDDDLGGEPGELGTPPEEDEFLESKKTVGERDHKRYGSMVAEPEQTDTPSAKNDPSTVFSAYAEGYFRGYADSAGTPPKRGAAETAWSKSKAKMELGETYKPQPASESAKVIRRLRIAESSAKAERDEAIELIDEAEKKIDEMSAAHRLEMTVVAKKLANKDKTKENKELTAQLESKNAELIELRNIVKEAKKSHEAQIADLKEQHTKEISEKIQEITTQSNRKVVDNYIDLQLSRSGLTLHQNTRTLFEACNSIEEVDEVFETVKEAMRRDALRPTPIKDIRLQEGKDLVTGDLQNVIKRTVRAACKGL